MHIGETFWESHEKFIDIQLILSGEEKIAYASSSALQEILYAPDKDLRIYKGKTHLY
ncbi:YhcH/YjgK/YiaL family protein [Candidatus Contubernalis alkalaceticus]|nr:YhcH/YjgK/YiaL family protein [Candidatus Contubernalis alkalaceticus]UNC93555.1 YhcH/YjgK/YiaL family protein [Candidatus Contubernalis alkalaceticus]